jgi:hypothetical protein
MRDELLDELSIYTPEYKQEMKKKMNPIVTLNRVQLSLNELLDYVGSENVSEPILDNISCEISGIKSQVEFLRKLLKNKYDK